MMEFMLLTTLLVLAACNPGFTEESTPMTEAPHPQFEHTEVKPALFGNDHMSEGVLLPLSDGRIMLAFRRDPGVEGHHVGTGGHIAQSIYDPAADRWSKIETIYSSNGRFDDRNIHGGVTRDGKLVLFMRRMRGNKQTEKRYILVSEDDGKTWSDLLESEAWSDPEASGIPGIWSTGQMFYNPDIEQYMMLGCRRYVTFSPDGITWEKVVKMTDSKRQKLTEVAGAWCGDNRVVALIRDNKHDKGHPLLQLVSRDNGKTWTDPEPSNIPPDKHWGCAPQVYYDAKRELLIAMTSTRYTKPKSEQALYVYTARPGEIIDNPEGWTLQFEILRPWADASIRDRRPLNHTFYGYPTIAPIGDDEYLVVFTERARMKGTEQADLYYFRMRVDSGDEHAPDDRGAAGKRYLFFDDRTRRLP